MMEDWKREALHALFPEYPPEAIEAATTMLDYWPGLFPSVFLPTKAPLKKESGRPRGRRSSARLKLLP